MLNFCHCVPGTWDVDCSRGEPDGALAAQADAARAALRARGELGLAEGPERTRWTVEMHNKRSEPRPAPARAPAGSAEGLPGLRIYVYELPPQYNIWMAAHFRRPGR